MTATHIDTLADVVAHAMPSSACHGRIDGAEALQAGAVGQSSRPVHRLTIHTSGEDKIMIQTATSMTDGPDGVYGEAFLWDDGIDQQLCCIAFGWDGSYDLYAILKPKLLPRMLQGDMLNGICYSVLGNEPEFGDFVITSISGGGHHGIHAVWIEFPGPDGAYDILEEGRNEALTEGSEATDLEIARKLAKAYRKAISDGHLMPEVTLHE